MRHCNAKSGRCSEDANSAPRRRGTIPTAPFTALSEEKLLKRWAQNARAPIDRSLPRKSWRRRIRTLRVCAHERNVDQPVRLNGVPDARTVATKDVGVTTIITTSNARRFFPLPTAFDQRSFDQSQSRRIGLFRGSLTRRNVATARHGAALAECSRFDSAERPDRSGLAPEDA